MKVFGLEFVDGKYFIVREGFQNSLEWPVRKKDYYTNEVLISGRMVTVIKRKDLTTMNIKTWNRVTRARDC